MRVRLGFGGLVAAVLLGVLVVPHMHALGQRPRAANENGARVPVLVELFTSEGCSDCPPADALLEKLDRSQPVDQAQLIVLGEHVDYWDGIGWRDPYSSHEYSERQGAFAGYFGLGTVYTPQMVVDGRFEFVGSDERRAIQAIEAAAKVAKVPVSLSSVRLEGANMVALHVESGPLPSAVESGSANVLLAVADESDQSQVSGGENAGRTLRHVAVVRTLIPVGTISKTAAFSQDVRINLNNGNSRSVRLVAFAQDQADGKIWGAGSARISK